MPIKNRLSTRFGRKSRGQNPSGQGDGGADPLLLDLVRLRVAQIHQCPISIALHLEDLQASGESQRRLDHLENWGASPLFDNGERAALALCEKITLDPARPLPDYLIREMRHYFTKEAIVSLTLTIIAVNDWNLLGCP